MAEDFNIGRMKAEAMAKAFGVDIEKGRAGVYEDNAENRRLNRVGQSYGSKKKEDEPKGKQSSGKQEQGGLEGHAQNASDEALRRAVKDPKASPEVKAAAQVEIRNRNQSKLGKGGRYKEFVDGDTGEVVKIWVPNRTKEEIAAEKEKFRKQQEENEAEAKKYDDAVKNESKLDKEYGHVMDEYNGCLSELKDRIRERKQLEIDQDEEVGALYVDGKDKEAEKLAQEYGEKFNKIDEEIESLKKHREELKPKVEEYRKKLDEIWNY